MEKTNEFENESITKENDIVDFDHLKDIRMFDKIILKAKKCLAPQEQRKVHDILDLISQGGFYSLESNLLEELMYSGIPDEIPSLRTLIWKLSLNYPKEIQIIHSPKWQMEINSKRAEYAMLKKKHFQLQKELKMAKSGINDHPLSNENDSSWSKYFYDIELLEEIEKDVRRTRAQMSFFFMPVDPNDDISNVDIAFKADQIREPTKQGKNVEYKFETHCDVLTRILFIYAKQYPELRYIQGMNEILAPLYYQFCLDNDCDNTIFIEESTDLKSHDKIEADSYFCFENLMSEIKDLFIREKDETRHGIQTRIKGVNLLLREVDKSIYNHFVENELEIQFFMFRWYTLLFTQEYEMPDVLRLWDSILSFKISNSRKIDKFMYVSFLCIALMLMKKDEILKLDFAGILLSFQNFDNLEVSYHITVATEIIQYYKNKYSGN